MPDEDESFRRITVSDPNGSMTDTSYGPYTDKNEASEYLHQRGWTKTDDHEYWQAVVDSRARFAWVRPWHVESKDKLPVNNE